ncbi:PKD domain-containing protein [Micromonospora haikouensis]|uniref:PKD domain-containing protein n=1 Tax=Micromonospora haikouensis TaxID=686309 RepID=UPI0037B0FE46
MSSSHRLRPSRHTASGAALSVLLALAAVVLPATPGSAAVVSDLDKIALSDTPTGVSAHPAIAADGDFVVTAWVDQGLSSTGYDDLAIRRSFDGGVTWRPRQSVTLATGPQHGAKHPSVAVRGQDVVIAFESNALIDGDVFSVGNHDVHLYASHNGGRTFESREIMVEDPPESVEPQVEFLDDDSVVLTWISGDGKLYLRRSDDHGRTWGLQQTITNDAARNAGDYLAAADGSAWIGWNPRNAGGARVAQVRPSGDVVVDEFGSGGTRSGEISVSAAGPVAAAGWIDTKASEGGNLPHAAVIRDGKDRTTASAPISTTARYPNLGDVTVDQGIAYVTWSDYVDWAGQVQVATSSDGRSWRVGRTLRPSDNPLGSEPRLTRARPGDRRTPVARIDWSMPDRYGMDADGDGLIDEHQDAAFIGRTDFDVDLDACAAEGGSSPITEYRWSIGGQVVTAENCVKRVQLAEGEYDTTLLVKTADGRTATTTAKVTVRDHLVVSIGDSVASGEGVPDVPAQGDTPARWQNEQCHRSARSGPSKAALRLEQADRRSSVTFLHLACSGASVLPFVPGDTTEGGLVTPYVGIVPGAPIEPQVDAAARLSAGRDIDALTVSTGANDLRFSSVVKDCITTNCTWAPTGEALDERLAVLPEHYRALDAAIDAKLHPKVTTISQYFDPVHDETGGVNLRCVADGVGTLVTDEEAEWAYQNVVSVLNGQVSFAAAKHGWVLADGIASEFAPHGYCARDGWVVQIGQSLDGQGDENGGFHPNVAGHETYGRRLAEEISAKLPAPVGDRALPGPAPEGGDSFPKGTDVVLTRNVGPDRVATPISAKPWSAPAVGTDVELSARAGLWAAESRSVGTSTGLASVFVENTATDRTRTSTWEVYGRLLPVGEPGIAVRAVSPVQAPDNPTVIVAGKATALRAEIINTTGKAATYEIEVTARGVEGGTRTFTQQVGLLGGRNLVHLLPEGDPLLPAAGESLEATVSVAANDANRSDDSLTSPALPVRPGRDLRIMYVPLGNSKGDAPSCREVKDLAARGSGFLQAALPVRELGIDATTSCAGAVRAVRGERGDDVSLTLNLLNKMATATGFDLVVGVGRQNLMIEDMKYHAAGAAFVGSAVDSGEPTRAAIVEVRYAAEEALAHEVGHTWGLQHVDDLGAPGYRVDEREVRDGIDIMSHVMTPPEWISAGTFGYLQQRFAARVAEGKLRNLAGERSLLVSLTANLDNPSSVRLSPLSVREAPPTVALGGEGTYQLRYLDGNGNELGSAGLTPGGLGERPEDYWGGSIAGISELVPYLDGTRTVQLRRGDDVLVERAVSERAPEVTVRAPQTIPAGSDLTVTWTATDGDTNSADLRSTVELSVDEGTSWLPVSTDVNGTEATLTVDAALAGKQIQVRVVTSDGVLTGTASATVQVGKRPQAGRIAFTEEHYSDDATSRYTYSLIMLDPATGQQEAVQSALQHAPDPDFSPDGRKLAWIHNRELVVSDPDSSNERTLAYAPLFSSWQCPDWSPDGRTIAATGDGTWISGFDVETGEKTRLVEATPETGTLNGSCPYFSPDGKKLAFYVPGSGSPSLWVYELATKELTKVVAPERPRDLTGWSPDGELLIAPDPSEHFGQTWAIKTDGTGYTRVSVAQRAKPNPHDDGWLAGDPVGGLQEYDLALLNATGDIVKKFTDYDNTSTGDPSWDSAIDWDWQPLVDEQPPPVPEPALADAGGPYTGDEGQTITLNAGRGIRPDGEIPLYYWDLDGDDKYDDAAGASVEYVIPQDGISTVAVRAVLADGTDDTGSATVTAGNVLPTVKASPMRTVAGVPTTLDTVLITDVDGAAMRAEVDWGDGSEWLVDDPVREVPGGWSVSATHTWTEPGTYRVLVLASDDHPGDYSAQEFQVTVLAAPVPEVTGVWPDHGPAAGGSEVHISGLMLGSVDEVRFGDTPAASVSVAEDGSVTAVAPVLPAGSAVDVTVVADGVTSKVTPDGRWTADGAPATVADATAKTAVDTAVEVPLEVRNPDGAPADLVITAAPEQGTATIDGTTLRYAPAAGFAGTVQLRVRAGTGPVAQVTITVGSRAPLPGGETLTAPAGTTAGTAVRVPLTALLANDVDPDGDQLTVTEVRAVSGGTAEVDGDHLVATVTGATAPLEFGYTVRDASGMTASTTSWLVLADGGPGDPAPTAEAGDDRSGAEGGAISIAGTVSQGATATWTVQPVSGVDAGATCTIADPNVASTTVTCTDDGVWRLTLTATSAGGTATDTATLTVTNAAPTVTVAAPTDGTIVLPGEAVTVRATVGDPGVNDTTSTRIDAGDGSAVRDGVTATVTYAKAGVYTITVTATDDDGATGTGQTTVIVRDPTATGGMVLGGGQLDDGLRVGFAGYSGRITLGGFVLHDAPAKKKLVAAISGLRITGSTAKLTGTGLWNSKLVKFEAVVVDGGIVDGKPARDTVQVKVLSLTGTQLWSTSGALPLHPGAALVKAK